MKKLQNLKGAKALNKKEQQSINGGAGSFCADYATEGSCQNECNSSTHECQMYFCSPAINGQGVGYFCVDTTPPNQ